MIKNKVSPNLKVKDGKLEKITALEQIGEYSKFQGFTDKQIYGLFFLGVETMRYERDKQKHLETFRSFN